MSSWISSELDLLHAWFGAGLQYLAAGHWIRLARYEIPSSLWTPQEVEVAFQLPPELPGQAPYAFFVRPELALTNGGAIQNYTFPSETAFGSDWGCFSWRLDVWSPGKSPAEGSNMLGFARSFADRFKEGA